MSFATNHQKAPTILGSHVKLHSSLAQSTYLDSLPSSVCGHLFQSSSARVSRLETPQPLQQLSWRAPLHRRKPFKPHLNWCHVPRGPNAEQQPNLSRGHYVIDGVRNSRRARYPVPASCHPAGRVWTSLRVLPLPSSQHSSPSHPPKSLLQFNCELLFAAHAGPHKHP